MSVTSLTFWILFLDPLLQVWPLTCTCRHHSLLHLYCLPCHMQCNPVLQRGFWDTELYQIDSLGCSVSLVNHVHVFMENLQDAICWVNECISTECVRAGMACSGLPCWKSMEICVILVAKMSTNVVVCLCMSFLHTVIVDGLFCYAVENEQHCDFVKLREMLLR